jgi:outer membrane protein assembly factor BamB
MKKSILFLLLIASAVFAGVNSQWRGPNRDGIYPEKNLLNKWPEDGPKLLWSVEGLGQGFSTASVTEDKVYVTGMLSGTGYVFAFDHNGKQIWKSAYGPDHDGDYPGSRTTPTVVDDRIYVISGKGYAVCLNAMTGDKVWSVNLVKTFGASIPRWGMTESPLVDGDHVFCTPGGSKTTLVALDRHTGKTVWTSGSTGQAPAYCSPILVQHGPTRLILAMTAKSVIGVDRNTGKLLWTHPHHTSYDVNANTPIYHDGMVFSYSGYGTGGIMLKLSADGKSVSESWRNEDLDSQHGAAVLIDGTLYGSGHNNRGWKSLDWKSGKTLNSSRDMGKGNVIFADGKLFCYDERGHIGLVQAGPDSFEVISRFRVRKGSGQHWAHLVVYQGKMYVRHGKALLVYQIGK